MNDQCKHEELTFWSGGYYVVCTNPKCNAKWVAIKQGTTDTDLDHSRSNMSSADRRVASNKDAK